MYSCLASTQTCCAPGMPYVCLPCVKDLFAGRDVSVIGEWMCKVPVGHCPFFCVALNLGLKPSIYTPSYSLAFLVLQRPFGREYSALCPLRQASLRRKKKSLNGWNPPGIVQGFVQDPQFVDYDYIKPGLET